MIQSAPTETLTVDRMSKNNLLVELFVEELPPKALRKLGDAFASQLVSSLVANGLVEADTAFEPFASPRRLAVRVSAVAEKAADRAQNLKLMPTAVGLDADGQPTAALLKRLQGMGLDASVAAQLTKQMDGKAEALFLQRTLPGVTLAEGLQTALDEAIAKLPIPKVMSYQLHTNCALPGWSSVNFVRPAHRLLALHGDKTVNVSALGLTAGNETVGHRFEAQAPVITIDRADDYEQQLTNIGAVIGANVTGITQSSTTSTLVLSGSNAYGGATTISAGTLRLGAANVIPDGTGKGNVAATGTLDLYGFSETINGLSGAGTVDNTAAPGRAASVTVSPVV